MKIGDLVRSKVLWDLERGPGVIVGRLTGLSDGRTAGDEVYEVLWSHDDAGPDQIVWSSDELEVISESR